MPQCCALGCSNQAVAGKIFHCLPSKGRNNERRLTWIKRIGRKNWIPTNNARLCEDHFTSDQYENDRRDGKKKLRQDALPSIFVKRAQKVKEPFVKRAQLASSVVVPDNPVELSGHHTTMKTDHRYAKEPSEQRAPLVYSALVQDNTVELSGPCAIIDDDNYCASAANSIGNIQEVSSMPYLNPKEEVMTLKRKLNLANKQVQKLQKELSNVKSVLNNFINEDQLQYLFKGSMQGSTWSNDTIRKSLQIRIACGPTGYNFLREQKYPLPCERTLQKSDVLDI